MERSTGRPASRPSQASPGVRSQIAAAQSDKQPPIGIHAMEAAADVLDPRAEPLERVWLQIDVAEFDRPCPRRPHQPIALPVDAGITDRTAGVVPDGEFGKRRGHTRSQ